MEAQEIKTVIERALVSYSGVSTGDGAAGGDTVVCSALTALPDYDGLTIIITEGAYAGQSRDINGSTTGGTINVEPVFSGQIVSGINFSILTGMPAYSELVDIMGTGFDTSTDSLVKLHDDHLTPISAALAAMVIATGTVTDVGATSADFDTDLTEVTNDHYNNLVIVFTDGVLIGQSRRISVYTGATKNIAVLPIFTEAPGNGDAFSIISSSFLDVMVERLDTQAKADVNTEIDNALDTAIPGSPTADSINELIKGLGDFEGLTNFSTLLALLGIPDTLNKPLYTVLVTDLLGHGTHGLVQLQADIAAVALEATLATHDTDIKAVITTLQATADTLALEATLATHDTDIKALLATIAGYIDVEIGTIITNIAALNNISTAQVNTEVDNALDTAIPGAPTADSINERIKQLDADVTTILGAYALEATLGTHDTDIKALLATIAAYLDTEVAAILAAVDTEVAAIETKLDTPANFMADVSALALEATLSTHDTDIKALINALNDISTTNVNTEVDNALDTAIPGAPTADSINERIKTLDEAYTATRAGYLDNIDTKAMGRSQIFEKSITSPANQGDVTLATITDQPCLIESVIIHADTGQPAHMTNCGVFGGAAKVITFIAAADALQADLDAIDKQVYWEGKVRLAATKTMVISLVGSGADNVDLTITIKYRASVSGGYLQ